jgi:hypothetical protein
LGPPCKGFYGNNTVARLIQKLGSNNFVFKIVELKKNPIVLKDSIVY